jgi:GntR family transcriptional regulator
MVERVVVPAGVFPGLERLAPLPNALYALYQREYRINIAAVDERLRADAARREDVRRLGVALGAPLLQIERVARTVEGRVVEWRLSRCDTTHLSYAVTLS